MSIEVISFLAGLLLVFIALIGGGFKAKEIEIPKVSPFIRILSAIVGIVLLVVGISVYFSKDEPKTTELQQQTEQQTEQQQKVFCPDCRIWNFYWIANGVQNEGLLVFNPTKGYGKMRVKFIDQSGSRIIQEEMNQVSTDQGQYIAGKNPFDTYTGQPIASYIPDNVIMDDETVAVFDNSGTYETRVVEINDVDAIIRVFNFTDSDLDF